MSTNIALPNSVANNFLRVAEESQSSELGGRIMKFVKGHYNVGDDEVPAGGEYVAHVNKLLRGYVKFGGGKLIEQRLGKVAEGFQVPKREELGDTDQTTWERDANGKPRDPWALQYYLPLESSETGEVSVFVTSSRGGFGAISNLCTVFARNVKNGLPVIKLGTSSYRHRTYGRIAIPDFPVVGWDKGGADTGVDTGVVDDDDDMVQVVSPSEDMDDACPF
jgi:hypothetical protein